MLIAARIIATALLGCVFAFGWPLLFTASMGYIWISVPVLLAAWAAAWFGDEVADLFGVHSDTFVRGLGLCVLVATGLAVAAARWRWFN